MKNKPLFVGELNPYGSSPQYALLPYPKNSTGWRLCYKILGIEWGEYVDNFGRVNLCSGKWDKVTAAIVASTIKWGDEPYLIVLLGSKVCNAFVFDYAPFSTMIANGHMFVILPHPSGLCRAWNEKGAYAKAKKVLRSAGVLPKKGRVQKCCEEEGPECVRHFAGNDPVGKMKAAKR